MDLRGDRGEEEGFDGASDVEIFGFFEGSYGVVEHGGLAVEEALVAEVGSGFELVEELADAIEVVSGGELGDGEGEGDAVEVGVGSEGGGAADLEDALRQTVQMMSVGDSVETWSWSVGDSVDV